jgi:hypothetical protein
MATMATIWPSCPDQRLAVAEKDVSASMLTRPFLPP